MTLKFTRPRIFELVSIRREGFIPRLLVHERYERQLKWILRFLTAIGIFSCLISLQTIFAKLSLAVALVLVEQLFERAVFRYTTIVLTPVPNFTYDPKKWIAMCFAYLENPRPTELNVVGPVFTDKEYAHQFFELLKEWNYGETDDQDNNINLSFIIDDASTYSVYLYANPDRPSVKKIFGQMKDSQKLEKYGKEQHNLIVGVTFCKQFPYGNYSNLLKFVEMQDKSRPFWLKPFLVKADGTYEIMFNEVSILKSHWKFKKRSELNKSEHEYQHGKNVMGL